MNYVEIIERQDELQKELQELYQNRIESAQSHTDLMLTEDLGEGISISLNMNYNSKEHYIITIQAGGGEVTLTIEDFNRLGTCLQKHGDAIFSYMSEITKEEDEANEVD